MLAFAAASVPAAASADNPIVQTLYTADPAPLVHDGVLYLYTTHDEDVTVKDFFTMNDWRVYSTTDVVNWTDHGSPLHYRDFSWASGSAWAGQVVFRNNKFYFYVPITRTNGGSVIGVAVSDSPTGPFVDPLDRPLVTSDCGDIDPSVFIDDDGQAYLYWGNPNLCYVKLNNDMTSYRDGVVKVQMNTQSFGARANSDRPTSYEEGPWFYKRDGRYYLVYPGGPLPEHIAYSTATSPTGPWTYQGVIMPAEGGSFTNHPGVVDYGGKSLFFYHNAALPGGGGFKRSVAVEEFTYGADGSIPQMRMTKEGARAVATLNPFQRVEAETMAWSSGVKTEVCSEGGMNLTQLDNGDYVKLAEVEFGAGATSFSARVAANNPASLELRLDSVDGPVVGTCSIAATGGLNVWETQTCAVEGAVGKHDLFIRFVGGGFKFNWWQFTGPGEEGETSGSASDATSSLDSSAGDGTSPEDSSAPAQTSDVPTSSGAPTGTETSPSSNTTVTPQPSNATPPATDPTAPPPSVTSAPTASGSTSDPSSAPTDAPTGAQQSNGGCACSAPGNPHSNETTWAWPMLAAASIITALRRRLRVLE